MTANTGGLDVPVPVCALSCSGQGAPGALIGEPRFTWRCEGVPGAQKAYRLVVERSGNGAKPGGTWDSGWVASADCLMVPYGGERLESDADYEAVVRVQFGDGTGEVSSAPVRFSTGLDPEARWAAAWLTSPSPWATAPMFRLRFSLAGPIARARLFITGLGYYEVFLNGARVGDHRLDPAWTDYEKRVCYAAYDVTKMLTTGDNAIGVWLGSGWYATEPLKNPLFTAQLRVQYIGGGELWVKTDPGRGWTTRAQSPIVRNSLYAGEVYDARLEAEGWSRTDFDEDAAGSERWTPAIETEPPAGKLVPQPLEPIRAVAELAPKTITETVPGTYVADFGQNLSGVLRLRVRSDAGARIVIRHAELIHDDGSLNTVNLRSATSTDEYVARGGEAVYEPRFTYHGFRYAEISGLGYPPEPGDILAIHLRSGVSQRGDFRCGDELVNRIQEMCVWTEGSNLHGVPTDCPQRDERLGWLNDLTVRAEEAVYNFDLHAFFSKYTVDIADAQGPMTGAITDTVPYFRYGGRPADPVCSSYLIIPWLLYLHYGDVEILRRHYDGLAAWVGFLTRQRADGIVQYSYYGDWAAPVSGALAGSAGAGAVSSITPGNLMSTGFLLMNAGLMSRIAKVLGKHQDAERYEALVRETRDALNREYLDKDAGTYATGSQAANAFMLYVDAVPETLRPAVAKRLAGDVLARNAHLTTGNLCSRYILEVLADNGYTDLAYDLVTQTTYPSWGYMLACGATTTWERWEYVVSGPQTGMASHNHPMNATVSAWFYRYLAGIRADGPGFETFAIRPYPPKKLPWASARLKTVKGEIHVRWDQGGDRFRMEIQVPLNSRCRAELPPEYDGEILVDGTVPEGIEVRRERRCVSLSPGRHSVSVSRGLP